MKAEFQFATYAPIVFLSALTKKRIHTLMPEVIKVYTNSRHRKEKKNEVGKCTGFSGKRLQPAWLLGCDIPRTLPENEVNEVKRQFYNL